MKKAINIFLIIIFLGIFSFGIYWNLPFEVTRRSDIKLGNELIKNINIYKTANGKLPRNDDWETLEKLGFKNEMLGVKPSYGNNKNGVYELVFLEGFDGPYLMWNSKEKKWKIDSPTIFN